MKWTIRKTTDGYVVKFRDDDDKLVFPSRALAIAYINNRVLSALGI